MSEWGMAVEFGREFNRRPQVWSRAPGRVNLIGDHTDYHDGFVFPAAINRHIQILAARRDDAQVRARSLDYEQTTSFRLDGIRPSPEASWSNYLRGVLVQYQKRGHRLCGMDLVIKGNVPIGAGLSSSAAFEVAVAELVRVLNDINIDRVQMALLAQAAERQFVGMQCGIMDQFVSALADEGCALLIDCRDLSYSSVPLPSGYSVVACDSKVQRLLTNSGYNERRSQSEEAARILHECLGRVEALRDVSVEGLERCREKLDPLLYRRARHVVTENARVQEGVDALLDGRIEEFGALLYASHASLRDDYEVCCPETDALVELARRIEGVVGARQTGGGFGGCTVNLIRSEKVEEFNSRIAEGYREKTGRDCEIHVCRPSDGVQSGGIE